MARKHISKASACLHRRHRFDPWIRKISWSRKWKPTPVLLPGKSHGQWSLAAMGLQRVRHHWAQRLDWILQKKRQEYTREERQPLQFVDSVLFCAEAFWFDLIPFLYFRFCFPCLRGDTPKILLRPVLNNILLMFSLRIFMVSGFTFKPLIYFEFIFVYGVRK